MLVGVEREVEPIAEYDADESVDSVSTRITSSGPPPTPAQIPTGELVALMSDRYRILRRIGRGGMGEVFLAEHTAIGKQVAIKILSEDFARKPRIVQRFLQEARASSAIRHENVVDITDYGHTPSGLPFLAMEYLVGEDLKATLRREGWLPWPRARRMVLQLLAALAAAHRHGVIHRDIKPENCFRLQRGDNPDFIKVLDFGIAKVVGEDVDQHLTQTGVVMGTAEYMSPEQARSDAIDARTDLYAVGVILFEMLTGRVPFRANGFMGTLSKHIMEPPPSPRQVAPLADISRALERVVLRALAKEPSERYPSAEAFAAALRALPPFDDGVARPPRRSWPAAGMAMVLGVVGLLRWAIPGGPAEGFEREQGVTLAEAVWAPAASSTDEPMRETWTEEDAASVESPADPPRPASEATRRREPRPRRLVPEKLSPEALGAGFAAVEEAVGACRKHGGLPGTVVHVQVTVTPEGRVEGATARAPYQGTSLGRCVEAEASRASFPRARVGQRAEPGFKL
jgi:serine/threonine-protein kinase